MARTSRMLWRRRLIPAANTDAELGRTSFRPGRFQDRKRAALIQEWTRATASRKRAALSESGGPPTRNGGDIGIGRCEFTAERRLNKMQVRILVRLLGVTAVHPAVTGLALSILANPRHEAWGSLKRGDFFFFCAKPGTPPLSATSAGRLGTCKTYEYSPVDAAKHRVLVALQVAGSGLLCSVLGWVASPLRDHRARADRLFVQLLVPRIRIAALQITAVRALVHAPANFSRPVWSLVLLPTSCPRVRTAQKPNAKECAFAKLPESSSSGRRESGRGHNRSGSCKGSRSSRPSAPETCSAIM